MFDQNPQSKRSFLISVVFEIDRTEVNEKIAQRKSQNRNKTCHNASVLTNFKVVYIS